MRPRGRSNSGDERDLPRIGKQVCCASASSTIALNGLALHHHPCQLHGASPQGELNGYPGLVGGQQR